MVVAALARRAMRPVSNQDEHVSATTMTTQRRYELDWLRAIIVLGAMLFHAIYELEIYFPQTRSAGLTTLTQVGFAFAIQWGLPLLFLIAGASAWLSLSHRSGRQFLKERVLRLLVPFIGCALTVIPLTMYLASLISAGPHLPFFQYYTDYFRGYAEFIHGNPLDHLIPLWGNLWFIMVIFLLSLLTLPLLLLLREPRGIRMIGRCKSLCQLPGGTLIPGVLLVTCWWLLSVIMPVSVASTLWPAVLCTLGFIAGALLYTDPSVERAVVRDGPVGLALAIVCFVSQQLLVIQHAWPLPDAWGSVLSAMLAGGFPWFGAIACLVLAKRRLRFTNMALDYLREAVFPYFLLHMLVLSVFGYLFLVQTHIPGVAQGLAILSCSALALALLYEFLIKRSTYLRLIFGMKPRTLM